MTRRAKAEREANMGVVVMSVCCQSGRSSWHEDTKEIGRLVRTATSRCGWLVVVVVMMNWRLAICLIFLFTCSLFLTLVLWPSSFIVVFLMVMKSSISGFCVRNHNTPSSLNPWPALSYPSYDVTFMFWVLFSFAHIFSFLSYRLTYPMTRLSFPLEQDTMYSFGFFLFPEVLFFF